MIGAIIMVHGDNSGLVLPPRIAPVQAMVIPIQQKKEGVLEKARELQAVLKEAGIRARLDDSDKSPGWKFSEQEMRGIPVRIECGPQRYREWAGGDCAQRYQREDSGGIRAAGRESERNTGCDPS